MNQSSSNRLIAWYGDDFTGSTDALEALASNGLRAVLFLHQPEDQFFSQFSEYEGFGLAGSSRSQTPDWMDAHLPAAFEWVRSLKTPVCHYKVCSTFDSAPDVGNIGRAIEIGKRVFDTRCVPVLVGTPSLRRYVVFGNLFATADATTWRIDRHPTMSRHPVTPMHEADLTLHLARQTSLPVRSFNILDLVNEDVAERFEAVASSAPIVVIDTLDQASLLNAGRLLWTGRSRRSFIVGSSGVEYSLTEWWRNAGVIAPPVTPASVAATDRLLVVSGSCSPVTERQIADADRNGFTSIRLDARALADGDDRETVVSAAIRAASDALTRDRSVVLYSAAGPGDTISANGIGDDFRRRIAEDTGRVLCGVLDRSGVQRVVVAGGDTSSHAGKQLQIDALTYVAPLAPGAPLCRAWSRRPERNALEVVFKGGQCGADDFFSLAKDGRAG